MRGNSGVSTIDARHDQHRRDAVLLPQPLGEVDRACGAGRLDRPDDRLIAAAQRGIGFMCTAANRSERRARIPKQKLRVCWPRTALATADRERDSRRRAWENQAHEAETLRAVLADREAPSP